MVGQKQSSSQHSTYIFTEAAAEEQDPDNFDPSVSLRGKGR